MSKNFDSKDFQMLSYLENAGVEVYVGEEYSEIDRALRDGDLHPAYYFIAHSLKVNISSQDLLLMFLALNNVNFLNYQEVRYHSYDESKYKDIDLCIDLLKYNYKLDINEVETYIISDSQSFTAKVDYSF